MQLNWNKSPISFNSSIVFFFSLDFVPVATLITPLLFLHRDKSKNARALNANCRVLTLNDQHKNSEDEKKTHLKQNEV